MSKKVILYFHIGKSSFVVKDIEMLSKEFYLIDFYFNSISKVAIPYQFIRQLIFLIIHFRKASHYITFFAGYHSFLPSLFSKLSRKKSIIILGGTDCHKYPEFNYGDHCRSLLSIFTCLSARWADLLLPVDESLIHSNPEYYNSEFKQGIRHLCSQVKTPFIVIPLEYDYSIFYRRDVQRSEKSFITIAYGIEDTSFTRKGIDLIIEAAKHLPDYSFSILGISGDKVKFEYPENIRLIEQVPYHELPDYYSTHQFYLQLSIAEGFPSAVCEAMLCECVPVGSRVAAIPGIIGDTGFILEKRSVDQLIELLESIVNLDDLEARGVAARRRIVTNFGKGTRQRRLREVITDNY